MPIFVVNGVMTVSCWTFIEADTEAEAQRIAEEREVAGQCFNALSPDDREAWHYDGDSSPMELKVERSR